MASRINYLDPEDVEENRLLTEPQRPRDPERLYVSPTPPPPFDPRERISRGFADVDIEDRRNRPDPMGFLMTGGNFDPQERKFSMIPRVSGYLPEHGRPELPGDMLNPLSRKLGIQDIDRSHAQWKLDRLREENDLLEETLKDFKKQIEERSKQDEGRGAEMRDYNARQEAKRQSKVK